MEHYRNDNGGSRYGRLESLLRQTFAVAGEIAEKEGRKRASSVEPLPGESTVIKKAVGSDTIKPRRHSSAVAMAQRKKRCSADDGGFTHSAESSMQEPFSPGALALSLDAILEGNRSDTELCCIGSSSPTSFPGRMSESPVLQNSGIASIGSAVDQLTRGNSPYNGHDGSYLHSKHSSLEAHCSEDVADDGPQLEVTKAKSKGCKSCTCCNITRSNSDPSKASCSLARMKIVEVPAIRSSSPYSPMPAAPMNSEADPQSQPQARSQHGHIQNHSSGSTTPPEWYVRILPVAVNPQHQHPGSTQQSLLKLEAVFPFKMSDNSAWNSEGSYYIIHQPVDDHVECSKTRTYDHRFQVIHDKSLQDFINEWQAERDTESST